jgi:hypothetical protein
VKALDVGGPALESSDRGLLALGVGVLSFDDDDGLALGGGGLAAVGKGLVLG